MGAIYTAQRVTGAAVYGLVFGVGVALSAAACSQGNSAAVGAVAITPPAISLAAVAGAQANTCSVGAVAITPPAISLAAVAGVQANACSVGAVGVAPPVVGLTVGACAQVNACSTGAVVVAGGGYVPTGTQYVTPQALVDEFGVREMVQLTDIGDVRTGQVDFALAQRICDRANAELGAAVAARYKLPLSRVPQLLRYIGQDLAHFYLYNSEPPTWVQTRFDQARKTLRDILTGALPLGVDDTGAAVPDAPQHLPQFSFGTKVFGRGSL